MRKSGDWSYVSFPASKSPPVTPKLVPKRPLSMLPQTSHLAANLNQPISLLESKVMASIIHNEANRGQHKSPAGRFQFCTNTVIQGISINQHAF